MLQNIGRRKLKVCHYCLEVEPNRRMLFQFEGTKNISDFIIGKIQISNFFFRKTLRIEAPRVFTKRDVMSTWYNQVLEFMERFNIKESWQVLNADETMLDTTLSSKFTWTSSKSYVKVNGMNSSFGLQFLLSL